MVFSGVCYRIKWGEENIEMQAGFGHYLSWSEVLLLYPSGLRANSCCSWIFSA